MTDSDHSKVALVTGASQGIGRGIALRLADDGFDIAINDIESKKDAIDKVVREIEEKGRRGIAVPGDVTEDSVVQGIVSKTVNDLGSLDVMVANAGIPGDYGIVLSLPVEEWDRVLTINARSVFLCYKYAAQQMVKQKRPGRIIGASSIAGKKGAPGSAPYCASKFAIRGLTQSVAAELGKFGITVNAYAPGLINTPLILDVEESITKATGAPGNIAGVMANLSALGRNGTTEDVANLVSFLVSPASQFITGQTICVDGGSFFD